MKRAIEQTELDELQIEPLSYNCWDFFGAEREHLEADDQSTINET